MKRAKEGDLIIVLLSGGGSALLPLPVDTISLSQLQILNEALIKSGATIQEINAVRKHCSRIKGGQMAKLGYPSTFITLILSDVIGNSVDTIASGPTVPDPTTYDQSIGILKKYDLWKDLSSSIHQHLVKGSQGIIPETPKPSDICFKNAFIEIIGDIKNACESIRTASNQRGFSSHIYSTEITGEAREISNKFLEFVKNQNPSETFQQSQPKIFIAGGEPTVTVQGSGVGGRCQEMGLAIIPKFTNLHNYVFAAIGTDGIDGFTDAAGVIIDKHSANLMSLKHLDSSQFLTNNDSYHFFKKLGDSLIYTGPTGTNVSDLILVGIF